MTQRVLVLNTGSSSLKWVVLDAGTQAVIDAGSASWAAAENSDHAAEIGASLTKVGQVDAVGHRVVHGGARYQQAVVIDDGVRRGISELSELAPLHTPAALAGIDATRQAWPAVPQVACFDTAFHATLPDVAATYAVPWEWTERLGIRRFGFHGLSVQYAVQRTAELLGALPRRMVVCHLGAGCSVTAVVDGRSIDTSMGFTPLDGLMMARRSGAIDPGIVLHLLGTRHMNAEAIDRGLNGESGIAGVSGLTDDMREVLWAEQHGHQRATLAVGMFVHRLVQVVGGMVAVIGGLEALVFTGGIGEHSADLRARVTHRLDFLGLRVDGGRNAAAQGDADLSAADSQVHTVVITAREDLAILRDLKRILNW